MGPFGRLVCHTVDLAVLGSQGVKLLVDILLVLMANLRSQKNKRAEISQNYKSLL